VIGWQSRDGRFYDDDEHLARWAGCTQLLCDCGAEMEKGYTICEACRGKADAGKYEAMPFKEWDGKTPLVIYGDDIYFWDEDGVLEYCEEHDCQPEDLRLVICEPQYAQEVEPNEYLCLPEYPVEHETPFQSHHHNAGNWVDRYGSPASMRSQVRVNGLRGESNRRISALPLSSAILTPRRPDTFQ
jgi:hypothetical protein